MANDTHVPHPYISNSISSLFVDALGNGTMDSTFLTTLSLDISSTSAAATSELYTSSSVISISVIASSSSLLEAHSIETLSLSVKQSEPPSEYQLHS